MSMPSTTASAAATSRSAARSDRTAASLVRNAALFVGLTLGVTVVAAAGAFAGIAPAMLPFILALAPAVIALGLARHEGNGAARRLLHSAVARPVRGRWYLALLIPILATLAMVPIAVALGEPSADLFAKVLPSIFIVPLVVLLPAFAEELGWRGYALPRLGTAMSPIAATAILGIPWAALHLALFLRGQMFDGIAIWPSVVGVFSLAVILSWIYVRTGSVLLTGLFHALFNGATPLMSGIDADVTWPLRAVVMAVIAVAIVALGGFRGISLRTPTS